MATKGRNTYGVLMRKIVLPVAGIAVLGITACNTEPFQKATESVADVNGYYTNIIRRDDGVLSVDKKSTITAGNIRLNNSETIKVYISVNASQEGNGTTVSPCTPIVYILQANEDSRGNLAGPIILSAEQIEQLNDEIISARYECTYLKTGK